MKLRSFFYILASIVVALLLIAAIGFYWLATHTPLSLLGSRQATTPAAAMFVSKQSPAVVSLLVSPDRLLNFRLASVPPQERRQARTELKQLQQSLLASTGLDYQQDIKPWIGKELTLAITSLDIDRDAANGKQPGYLLAIATRDPERSREFLQLFWQKRALAGADLVFEQYKGVKIIHGNPVVESGGQKSEPGKGGKGKGKGDAKATQNSTPTTYSPLPPPALSSAAVGDRFILFANHPKVLRDAINNVQAPDLSLDHASFYTQALEALTNPRIGLTFVNLPRLAEWSGVSSPTSLSPQAEGTTPTAATGQPAPPDQTLAVAFKLDRLGLLADTALIAKDGKEAIAAPSLSQPVAALQYVPASSPLAASGINLALTWEGFLRNLQTFGTASKLVNQPLLDLQKQWQIDLPKDIFSWVKGEYALGLVPKQIGEERRKEAQPSPLNDWIFIAQRDSDAAKNGIEHLDTIAQNQGLSVGPVKLGNQTISTWTKLSTGTGNQKALALQADVRGVHATVGNYEVFTTSIAAMDRALKAVEKPLTKSDRFQQAIAPLQQPNNGYLYLDWATSQPLLERQFPILKVVELAGKPLFDHLQSLTVSSYGGQAGVQRGGVFIKLASNRLSS